MGDFLETQSNKICKWKNEKKASFNSLANRAGVILGTSAQFLLGEHPTCNLLF